VSTFIEITPDLQAAIQEKADCQIELQVKISPALAQKARKDAIKKVSKEFSIAGFRPGKAPEELVVKQAPSAIDREWRQSLADLSFYDLMKSEKVPLFRRNSPLNFDIKTLSPLEGSTLVFFYETNPKIPSVNVKDFILKSIKKHSVGEKEIEEALKQYRFFFAEWKDLDHPIQENDFVIIDLEALDTTPPTKVFSHTRFEVTKNGMANWMKKLLLGAKKGEIIEGVSEADEDLPEKEKKNFSPKKVRVTIVNVEEAILPEVNEDFCKKLGVPSVENLKKSIEENLLRQAEEGMDAEKRKQVNDFLLKQASFDLPYSLVKSEEEHRLKEFLKNPKAAARFEKMTKPEKEKTEKEFFQEAKNALSIFYLSQKILEDANISITEEEVKSHILPDQSIEEYYGLTWSRLSLEKAQDYVISQGQASKENS
jgi:trigger factor